jgi:hypothetical protein
VTVASVSRSRNDSLAALAVPAYGVSTAAGARARPPRRLAAAERQTLLRAFGGAQPVRTYVIGYPNKIAVVWELDRVVICGACIAPSNASPRPRLVEGAGDPSLARLAQRYAFGVMAFRYLARDRAVDPVLHGGLSYHAFFFEARDGHGVSFIAPQHSIVNAHGQLEGEQWDRGPTLFPFPHG